MDKENTYPLIFIEWQDARDANKEWQHLDDFEPEGLATIRTVGYLIPNPDRDPSYLTTAQTISVAKDKKDTQICGIIYIPTATIVRKHFIKIPNQERVVLTCSDEDVTYK